jgi:hypothetical protein
MSQSRDRSMLITAALVVAAGVLAGGLALRPALANGGKLIVGPYTIIMCSSSSACQQYTNGGGGPGLEGKTGHGTGLYGLASTTGLGVVGTSMSGTGVSGTSTSATGVAGTSSSSYGVFGEASTGTGVQGQTSSSRGQSGVSGISIGTTGSAHGVYGRSTNGQGVYGTSSGSNGVEGHSTVSGGSGVAGIQLGTSSGSGDGVYSESADTTNSYEALEAKADSANTYIFEGFNSSTDGLCTIDYNAALACTGGAVVKNVQTRHLTSDGRHVTAYASESTSPTLEDFGNARIVAGVADVEIDPSFASTVRRSADYFVFLTPMADTRGLYVSAKRPSSFEVREAQGGHSTLFFDYRIVARPFDATGGRLPPAAAMRVPAPRRF